jgi:hypothetical protein
MRIRPPGYRRIDNDNDEDEEADHTHMTNVEYKGKLRPPPIPLAAVRVVLPPKNLRRRLA